MNIVIQEKIPTIKIFDDLIARINLNKQNLVIPCSPMYGASKSSFVLKIVEKENQIVILLPELKLAEELFVELNLLGLSDRIIFLNEFTDAAVQENSIKFSDKKDLLLFQHMNF